MREELQKSMNLLRKREKLRRSVRVLVRKRKQNSRGFRSKEPILEWQRLGLLALFY